MFRRFIRRYRSRKLLRSLMKHRIQPPLRDNWKEFKGIALVDS